MYKLYPGPVYKENKNKISKTYNLLSLTIIIHNNRVTIVDNKTVHIFRNFETSWSGYIPKLQFLNYKTK